MIFSKPEVSTGPTDITEYPLPFADSVSASAQLAFRDTPIFGRYSNAEEIETAGEIEGFKKFSKPEVEAQAKEKGFKLDVPEEGYNAYQLKMIFAREQKNRDLRAQYDAVEHGAVKSVVSFGTDIATSLVDPANMLASFIPVGRLFGYADRVAAASSPFLTRAAFGALEGGVGALGTEALNQYTTSITGEDYSLSDSIRNFAFGAGMGATIHAGLGLMGAKPELVGEAPFENLAQRMDEYISGKLTKAPELPSMPEATGGIRELLSADKEAKLFGQESSQGDMMRNLFSDLPVEVSETLGKSALAQMLSDRPVQLEFFLSEYGAGAIHEAEQLNLFREAAIENYNFTQESFEGMGASRAAESSRGKAFVSEVTKNADAGVPIRYTDGSGQVRNVLGIENGRVVFENGESVSLKRIFQNSWEDRFFKGTENAPLFGEAPLPEHFPGNLFGEEANAAQGQLDLRAPRDERLAAYKKAYPDSFPLTAAEKETISTVEQLAKEYNPPPRDNPKKYETEVTKPADEDIAFIKEQLQAKGHDLESFETGIKEEMKAFDEHTNAVLEFFNCMTKA